MLKPTTRLIDGLIVAVGLLAGGLLGLGLDMPDLSGLTDLAGDYLLAPLVAAVNAGISCF